MDGARVAREKNLTFSRNVRVQPCIRPLSAAVLAAGPDVTERLTEPLNQAARIRQNLTLNF
jgi:hypothetical protein